MNYTIFIRPLIGAAIGYITNWIAVKMLFRPLKPIKFYKFQIPFTPGIIPKNKKRIAHSIANTISNDLLTEKDLNNLLLSSDIENKIKLSLSNLFDKNNNITIEEKILDNLPSDTYFNIKDTIINNITNKILNSLDNINVGKIISDQINIAVEEKINNSLIRAFINNTMLNSLTATIEEKINLYIADNGENFIKNFVTTELDKYAKSNINSFIENLNNKNINIIDLLIQLYHHFINNKLSIILKHINISKIIEDKINNMNMLELEKMILNIMKKELNALVNIGALIGFILGLLNLLF